MSNKIPKRFKVQAFFSSWAALDGVGSADLSDLRTKNLSADNRLNNAHKALSLSPCTGVALPVPLAVFWAAEWLCLWFALPLCPWWNWCGSSGGLSEVDLWGVLLRVIITCSLGVAGRGGLGDRLVGSSSMSMPSRVKSHSSASSEEEVWDRKHLWHYNSNFCIPWHYT